MTPQRDRGASQITRAIPTHTEDTRSPDVTNHAPLLRRPSPSPTVDPGALSAANSQHAAYMRDVALMMPWKPAGMPLG